jgi:hypothetical protein
MQCSISTTGIVYTQKFTEQTRKKDILSTKIKKKYFPEMPNIHPRIERVGSEHIYITKFHVQRARIRENLKREAWHGGREHSG